MLDRPDLYGAPLVRAPSWPRGGRCKYSACDRGLTQLGRAMELMETYGADRAHDVEKHWRDLKIVQLWMGGKQLCQMEAARYYYGCETL